MSESRTFTDKIEFVRSVAVKGYTSNLVPYAGKKYLPAGAHQFYTLWVRDFCYSVPGLIADGSIGVIEDQLDLIFSSMNAEGLLPRGLDVINPKTRVLLNTIFRFLPASMKRPRYEGKVIHPEYKGEHGTIAFDSLLLVPWALVELCLYREKRQTGSGRDLLGKYQPHLQKIFLRLRASIKDGLFWQDAFSDWQDSTRREGFIFTSHVLYLRLFHSAKKLGMDWFTESVWPTEKSIFTQFFNDESYLFENRIIKDKLLPAQVSLEAHAWVIQDSLFSGLVDQAKLYKALISSKLWKSGGYPVYPASQNSEIAWTTKAVGLTRYHDGLVWSWLVAEAFKTCMVMNDHLEAEKVINELVASLHHDKHIFEVYERIDERLVPFSHPLYKSEYPFSWGACKWLEALSIISR